jgi:hypothetical protein
MGHAPNVLARRSVSLLGVGRRVGPCGGLVSAPVVTGQAGGRVVCSGGVGTGGAPESGGTGRVSERGVVPMPPRTAASDGQKRPLRSRFWPRLSRSVRCLPSCQSLHECA